MKDVMLDFETFGNGKSKVVCQVINAELLFITRRTNDVGYYNS